MILRLLTFLAFVVLFSAKGFTQQQLLKGIITDEHGIVIPMAKVYVKNNSDLRTVADINGYYEMRLMEGEYFLVVTAIGYDDREAYVAIIQDVTEKNIQLFATKVQDLEDVTVSAKKSNPGREIMLKVVEKREQINAWNYPHTVDGYIRASEKIDRKQDEESDDKKKKKKNEEPEATDPSGVEDPFAEKKKEESKIANGMNLVEVTFIRHYADRFKIKEIRSAYEERGEKRNNLYYTTTVKSNFNFFENLLHLDDLHQTPVSSPISGPGILSYKYRLEAQYEENGQLIDKIKIIPRNTATTTLEGYIYVIDSLWLIQKLELTMEKGNLLVYDYFTIEQTFTHPGDTLCVLKDQKLTYGVAYKNQTSTCTTFASFKNYNFSPNFPPKFFSNELSVTEQEAYEKDSVFWKENRTVDLSLEEQQYIITRDSIHEAHNRVEYLDSVDADFNKITALKILWFGVDHRNRAKKTQWTINSLAGLIQPIYIAGPRIQPGFFYFKKWANERYFDGQATTSIGVLNGDVKGSVYGDYRYDPFHFGTISGGFFHEFDVIRNADAISQIYKRDNFIEVTQMTLGHSYEVVNGLYIDNQFDFTERRSLEGYKFLEIIDDVLPNNDPNKFETYQAFISKLSVSYIPNQKYMREPNRKVILGSKWPTFYAYYEKGIAGVFGSDVNHDYVLGGIRQTFKIGTIGTSSYNIKSGLFLNTINLKDADQKFHRRSDPIWFSNPLNSFQALDSLLPTQKAYLEAHFIHHDNGSIINKIPFMKKTQIGLVVGTSALYIPEHSWQHYELYTGLERTFKFSKRRLRIGVYGVVADGNRIKPTTDWKISFALLNNRNLKWNF